MTEDATPYTVPKEPGRWRAIGLAALVHLALLAFLWIGIRWQNQTPVAMEAEVWSPQPREAAPLPQPAPPQEPEPKPEVQEPPKPKVVEPPPPPKPEVKPAEVKPDIALEQEKKRKAEEEKRRQDQLAEEKREKERLEKERLEKEKKLAEEKAQREKERKLAEEKAQQEKERKLAEEKVQQERERKLAEEKAQKEKERKLAEEKAQQEKKLAAEKKRKQEEAEQQMLAKAREEEMRRITGGVTGSGGTGDAARSQGSRGDASYAQRVAAKIKSNISFSASEGAQGNPAVEYEVNLLPDGSVAGIRRIKSSGIAGFDDAVRRAIEKSQPYPKDKSGSVPSSFIGIHKLKDQ